jgi:hypothetical protein
MRRSWFDASLNDITAGFDRLDRSFGIIKSKAVGGDLLDRPLARLDCPHRSNERFETLTVATENTDLVRDSDINRKSGRGISLEAGKDETAAEGERPNCLLHDIGHDRSGVDHEAWSSSKSFLKSAAEWATVRNDIDCSELSRYGESMAIFFESHDSDAPSTSLSCRDQTSQTSWARPQNRNSVRGANASDVLDPVDAIGEGVEKRCVTCRHSRIHRDGHGLGRQIHVGSHTSPEAGR